MNVLWAPARGVYLEMIELFCKKYGVDNLYLFHFEQYKHEVEHTSLMPIVRERFLFMDMMDARYEGYIWYETMSPLDKKLLDAMSPYEAEALKMFERAYGRNNPAEMRFMQYHQHVRYWNHFLDKSKIDVFFANATPHACYDYVLMRLCQLRNIPVIQFLVLPFITTPRCMLGLQYEGIDERIVNRIHDYKLKYSKKDAYDIKLPLDMEKEYESFMRKSSRIVPVRAELLHPIRERVKIIKHYLSYSPKLVLKRFVDHYSIRIKTGKIIKKYNRVAVHANYKEKYIYFPMHYQPEMTTSPLGGWFVHQYLVAEMISYYMPKGVYLYVREHPGLKSFESNTTYAEHIERISRLPNVKMISMEDDAQKLIDNAFAVASITGSVGYEVLYRKKPYIMFGDQVMKYGPGTINVRNNEDCKKAMETIFGGELKYDEKDIRIFLKVISELSARTPLIKGTNQFKRTDKNREKLLKMFSDAMDEAMSMRATGKGV